MIRSNSPRIVGHADITSAYANIAIMEFPYLRGRRVAVGGDPESRHGIILASNPEAKRFGVKTGSALWQAREACPNLVIVPIHDLGRSTIRRVSDDFVELIYALTPQLQMEGDDGVYFDLTGCVRDFGEAEALAHKLRLDVQHRLGVTISVGISFNRNFAKIGSDFKKPNAVTVISPLNWKEIVWPLPVSDLYWVGPRTTPKLQRMGLNTIGQLAAADLDRVYDRLGVIGRILWLRANGHDPEPILYKGEVDERKTDGNSSTALNDLMTLDDILAYAMKLCEVTSESLRRENSYSIGIKVGLRSADDLRWIERQKQMPFPTRTCRMMFDQANLLIQRHWDGKPLRGLGIRAFNLLADDYLQMALLPEMLRDQRNERIDQAIQDIHRRMGAGMMYRGRVYGNKGLMQMDLTSLESAQRNAFRRV